MPAPEFLRIPSSYPNLSQLRMKRAFGGYLPEIKARTRATTRENWRCRSEPFSKITNHRCADRYRARASWKISKKRAIRDILVRASRVSIIINRNQKMNHWQIMAETRERGTFADKCERRPRHGRVYWPGSSRVLSMTAPPNALAAVCETRSWVSRDSVRVIPILPKSRATERQTDR